jgi:hypothetical protein
MRAMVSIESTLAINTVEAAQLASFWQKIDAKRNAQTATVDWAKDR